MPLKITNDIGELNVCAMCNRTIYWNGEQWIHKNGENYRHMIKPKILPETLIGTKVGIKVSDWIEQDDCFAFRIVENGDPENIADRVAAIEKTPRVRISPFTSNGNDFMNWLSADFKGGNHQSLESRKWCDEQLIRMGYILP